MSGIAARSVVREGLATQAAAGKQHLGDGVFEDMF